MYSSIADQRVCKAWSKVSEDMERTIMHPEHNKQMTLWELLGMYAWHGKHHVAHVTSLRERMKW